MDTTKANMSLGLYLASSKVIEALSYLNLIVCSFGFSLFGNHPRFYGSLFFLPLVSHLWEEFVGSISGHSLFPLVCHHWDAP